MTFFSSPAKLICFSALLYSSTSLANWELSTFLDVAGDTNARRSEPKQGDTQFITGLDLNHEHNSAKLQTAIDYRLSRQTFIEHTNSDRNLNIGQAQLNYALRPNWQVSLFHESSETLTDSRDANVADNRQQRDSSYINSSYNINLNKANQLSFQLNSSYTRQDNTPLNTNTRYGANIVFRRNHSSSISSQVSYANNHIDYKSSRSQDYQLHDLSYSLNYTGPKLSLQLGGGYNLIDQEGQADVDGSSLFAEINYLPSPTHNINLLANRRLTDSSTGLNQPGSPSNEPGPSSSGSNIEIASRLEASYQLQISPIYSGFIRYIFDDSDLQNQSRRDTNTTLTIGSRKALSRASSLSLEVSHQRQKRREINSERRTDEIRLGYNRRINQRLNLDLDLGFNVEEESPRFNGIDSLENGFYILRLNYQLY